MYYWNLWWFKRAVTDLHTSPLFTRELYYPYGASLYFHTLNLFGDALALPLMYVASTAVAYNALVFASFVLSGYAVYRLALEVVGPTANREAFLAGVAFMCSSYRLAHLIGHLDLVSTQWIAFYCWCLVRARDGRGWVASVAGGVMFAACGLTTAYYLLFALLLAAVFVTHAALVLDPPRRGAAVMRIVATVAVGVATMSPALLPMLTRGTVEGRVLDPRGDAARFSVDLFAFLVPSLQHPWWGTVAGRLQDAIQPGGFTIENVVYLGIVPLGLALVARGPGPARRFWTTVAIVFGVLALGPTLRVGGYTVPALSRLMPYRLLARLPYGDIPRVPARFALLTMLAVSVLAAMGARSLIVGRRLSTPAYVALLGLMFVDTTIAPLPLNHVDAPPFFERLATEPARGALVEVPIPDDPARYPLRMFWQTIHGRPVFGGYLARGLPPLPFAAIPGFGQFTNAAGAIDDVVRYDPSELPALSRAVLNAYGAGLIAVERRLMSSADGERAQSVAEKIVGPSAIAFADDDGVAYRVPPDRTVAAPAIWLDRGWSYLERRGEDRWRWMGDAAHIGLVAPRPVMVSLAFDAEAFSTPRRLRVVARDVTVAELEIDTATSRHETSPFAVDAGTTWLVLDSIGGSRTASRDPRRLTIAIHAIAIRSATGG